MGKIPPCQWDVSPLPDSIGAWEKSHMGELSPLAQEILRRMKQLGLNQKSLAIKAKLNETAVRDIIKGKSKHPRQDTLEKLAAALRCSIDDLVPASTHRQHDAVDGLVLPKRARPDGRLSRQGRHEEVGEGAVIDELDVRAAAGGGGINDNESKVDQWIFPKRVIRVATNAMPEHIKIITVIGDSMPDSFRSNDKVMVDTEDKNPSPPGIFAVWDGLGLVVKRVEFLPFSDPPTVRITSENPAYTPYERTLDEAHIQGRVLGKWMWV